MDPFATAHPGAAFDAFEPGARERAAGRTPWTPQDGPLPALYLSHGAPPLFDDAEWMTRLGEWADRLPTPKAILIVSAHWESAPLTLTSAEANTPLVYDFGGFAERFYRMTYATPDASALAARVAATLPDGQPAHASRRGLDHGAWVPLKVMYPLGDVPVLQMSMPTEDPDRLLAIGARLRELRSEGVLVIGSGFMTHGLPFLSREMLAGQDDPGLDGRLRRLGRRGPRPRRPRDAAPLPRGPGHALRAPDGRALRAAVRHPRRGHRPRGPGDHDDRRHHVGPLPPVAPGGLRCRLHERPVRCFTRSRRSRKGLATAGARSMLTRTGDDPGLGFEE